MEKNHSGFFYYIDQLIQENKLVDKYINQATNQDQTHVCYCFSLHPALFFRNPAQHNIHQRRFFHGLKYHDHHITLEEKFQFDSDIHYTCCFINPSNPFEKLKFSIFFDRDKFQVTRINYRYTHHQMLIKGDIPLSSSPHYDLSKVNPLFHIKNSTHETLSIQGLEKMARNALAVRIDSLLKDYNLLVQKSLKKLSGFQELFENAFKKFKTDKSYGIAFGTFSSQHLEALLEYFKIIVLYIDAHQRPYSVKSLEDKVHQLKNDIFFLSFSNAEQLLKEVQAHNTMNPLVHLLHDSSPKEEVGLIESVKMIYKESLLSGDASLFTSIHLQFSFDLDYVALTEALLEKIELESKPSRKKLISIAELLFQTQLPYTQVIKKHAQKLKAYKAQDQIIMLDLFSQMFLKKNYEAFCMYVDQGALQHLPKGSSPNLSITQLSKSDEESKPYLQYLHKANILA